MNADMLAYDNHRGRHSVVRYHVIQKALTEAKGSVSINTIKTILEQKMPNGVFCPYYDDYLGTLHSIVFDVSNTKVEISSASEKAMNEYADDPDTFWSVLPSGSMNI